MAASAVSSSVERATIESAWANKLNLGGLSDKARSGVSAISGALAGAAARSLITGTSFGDNVLAVLPDVIAQTFGNSVGEGLSRARGTPVRNGTDPIGDLLDEINTRSGPSYGGEPYGPMLPIDEPITALNIEHAPPPTIPNDLRTMNDMIGGLSLATAGAGSAQAARGGSAGPSTTVSELVVTPPRKAATPRAGATLSTKGSAPPESAIDRFARQTGEVLTEAKVIAATEAAKKAAGASIGLTLLDPRTSPISKEILSDFVNGSGPNQRVFGPNSPGTKELMSGLTGEYYRSSTERATDFLAKKYGGTIPDGAHADSLGRDYSAIDGVKGLLDGTQVGDVIGTFTSGISVEARNGILHFEATNKMSLSSFSGENLLNHGLVRNPTSGPYSTKAQTFLWTAPIPPKYRPK